MMGKYWKLLAEYDSETAAYTAAAGANAVSPYTPTENAKLIGLRVIASAVAATTLTEHVQFKLTCSTFKPNSIEVGGQGIGLATAPRVFAEPIDWSIDQPVQAGVPITIEGRCTVGTDVTNTVYLWGEFIS
jgi:hypothetical protein